jgi:dsDNA-specific endonuclease/ATPase MutS2
MPGEDSKSLAEQVARQVEDAISSAQGRAEEIVATARREAEQIRSAAEAEAEERIRRAQEAVDRLVAQAGQLRDAVAGEPAPPPAPEPKAADRAPEPAGETRSTEDLIEQMKGGGAKPDEGGARLVAMKMALDGKPRDEVERHLQSNFELDGTDALLDDVYARVGK